ncbi:manganese-dependent inorganic pyrophosphatase [Hasllibacter halocynthiae]|uniref:inorganic diphosphatase n=1 Tax=Hasllibacter halocynthiae TaxID=595589 RepID=A0A2T0X0X6_9RHOB|nr:manganese-dependent inorganic pyrophosphatase [Hasllibacter halocynthiae]PRY92598.1 manganese-dependent inorganic pyrophosphatase [Hasllibacter halocynthiae]
MIRVFGHKSPDTDSTAAPILWAWHLNGSGREARPALLGEPNTEALFVLDRWSLERPEVIEAATGDVVVVDTNNPAELPDLADADVIGIIDHHRLVGGIETAGPIDVTIRPLACTVTVMAEMMGDERVMSAPEGVRGAALSAILSDTLEFRSPTTTPRDRDLAERLAEGLGVSIPDYAAEMFAAKSDVSAFSEAELIRMDSKEVEVGSLRFRVSVLETTSPEQILGRKDALLDAMPKVAVEDGLNEVLLFVVDILREEAHLLLSSDLSRGVAEKSFGAKAEGDVVVLPGVMSRKKQIIPALKA